MVETEFGFKGMGKIVRDAEQANKEDLQSVEEDKFVTDL